jgi:hypothetical protein
MLDMLAAMARLGARHEKMVIHVSHEAWFHWVKDSAAAHHLSEQRHNPHLIDIYGPSGLVVTVRRGLE